MSTPLMKMTLCLLLTLSCGIVSAQVPAGKIVHDAEYYILEAQNGQKWAAGLGDGGR